MERKRFQYLWDAFDAAVKEKAANPMSSRLTSGVEVLVRQEHDVLTSYRTSLDALVERTQALAGEHGLPSTLVSAVVGYNRDQHRQIVEQIEELDLLLGAIGKARR
jgi:hypothetical protein